MWLLALPASSLSLSHTHLTMMPTYRAEQEAALCVVGIREAAKPTAACHACGGLALGAIRKAAIRKVAIREAA